ncbi:signal peptidase I [Sphingomonas bacterium]|uniref:signal peptidase I n=1 Tax=Sphingomonas bacterium TaxID=1895847 RepID=UPI001576B03A|nr:signal peptidase I [Sphingomonas bacterium]
MKDVALDGEDGTARPGGDGIAADGVGADGSAATAKRGTDWWGEIKGIFWLIVIVLGFHSFVAKPFYIPSESMLPGLQVGDRLVVSKFTYGWSFVSPTIPNPVAIFDSLVLHEPEESWAFQLPFIHGRLLGRLPERGDVVIVTPPGTSSDYIKRVIGLPGDRLEVRGGTVILNGVPVKRGPKHDVDIARYGGDMTPDGETCGGGTIVPNAKGYNSCRLPVVTETLPGGRTFDTVDDIDGSQGDDYHVGHPITIPAGHVFLMGDNRDHSADSRFPLGGIERGLGGPVPFENIGGRAEFITFSLDATAGWNPLTWFGSLRGSRAGQSLHPQNAAPPAAGK